MMQIRTAILLAIGATLALASRPAEAHFLWALTDTSSKTFTVLFAEAPGDSVLPDILNDKKELKVWEAGGQKLQLTKTKDGFGSPLKGDSAGADLVYGVMDKEKEGRGVFLLHYYAKASANPAASSKNLGLGVELFATTDAKGNLTVTVMKKGKPVPSAEFHADVAGLPEAIEGKTDAKGQADLGKWTGAVAVRASTSDNTPGELDGKKYPLIRYYSSLTLQAPPLKADPAAYALLEKASLSRQIMPNDVVGLQGKVTYQLGEKSFTGTFKYNEGHPSEAMVAGLDEEGSDALQDQISSIFDHRHGGDFSKGDGRHPLTFTGQDGPLGKQIEVHDDLFSSYRVKGDEITEVDRRFGDHRFIVTIIENARTPEGKLLSKHFIVNHFDQKTGTLLKSETFTDEFAKIDGAWVPVARAIVTAEKGGLSVRKMSFSDVKLIRATN